MLVTGLIGLCLVLSVFSFISNQNLPVSDNSDHLNTLDKARVSESTHLKSILGDQVWLGLGDADIPTIIWNESFEFLVNYENDTPAGWEKISDDDLNGQPYFRRKAEDPQNFAIQVEGTWAASIASKQTTDVFLVRAFQDTFPSPIKQVFPYQLILQPSETQLGAVLHEAFHVYQYQTAPHRMDKAESVHKFSVEYEAASDEFISEWKRESALLADALKAKDPGKKAELVHEFLSIRDARRSSHQMNTNLINYEQWLEWEEGTAKYIELAFLKTAGESISYQPISEMSNDPDFKQYQKFNRRWSQEMLQLRYQTTSGESQFYMTGMAQAFLLDDLIPDWKEKYWEDGVFLEDLLRTAVTE